MRIDAHDTIAGLPAREARYILRRLAPRDMIGRGDLAWLLRTSERRAGRLLKGLEAEGYLERIPLRLGSAWILTERGNALRMATAAKAIRRTTADRLVAAVT